MRRRLDHVPEFDYEHFPPEDIRKALLHMRDLGQVLYDLRQIVETTTDERVHETLTPILAERNDFADDYVEIGFGHLHDEAGFLRHVHVLGELTPEQRARVDAFRADFDERLGKLREEASAIQDQYARARRAYYALHAR